MVRRGAIVLLVGLLVGFLVYIMIPFKGNVIPYEYSQVILARDTSILRVYLNREEQWCLPPSLNPDIPPKLETAVLSYEDQYFYAHPGVNPLAIARAIYLNFTERRIISGGSTITMQVARMRENKARTFKNKFFEMLLAFKIEWQFTKKEVLSTYLSHAPYGSNVRGLGAACHRFFGKTPHELTWSEAATLAVLPNAPGMIFPSQNSDLLANKRNQLLKRLYEKEIFDKETYELSLLERIPDQIIPFPLSAPHLTDKIHLENNVDIVRTTIDQNLQYETNFFLKQHSAQMAQMGIFNASAIVVHNPTGQVRSYVGSQNYYDQNREGKVDGIQASRSSGSILKPFLYALAVDEGLILPETLIKDVPTYFSSFSPSNASESFSGISRASEALIYSLNIPAVRLLNAFGVDKFYNLLKAGGISTLFRSSDHYGLPIILGGAEVSPWDIAKLYNGLASGGDFGEISYLANSESSTKENLISPAATYLMLNEMKELIRPGLEFYWKKYGTQKPISWKTGTSYGHKDAWAAGVSPEWTVVVWVGNFDGSPNKMLSGMMSAGPLLFNIFNILPENKQTPFFEPNENDFVEVALCKETGFYASDNCEKVLTKAPKNMKPLSTCAYHHSIFIEEDYLVCSHCWTGKQQEKKLLSYTPDINYYLRKNGTITTTFPTHKPSCSVRQEQESLTVLYPPDNANVFLPKDFSGEYEPMIARVSSQYVNREVFWYLDDNFLGSTIKKPTIPISMYQGKHVLTVVDSEGNRDEVRFSVIRN